MKKTKGFTLVELLVVIAILAILATVSVVGYTSFIDSAKNSVAQQELTQIKDYALGVDMTDGNKNGKIDADEVAIAFAESGFGGSAIWNADKSAVKYSATNGGVAYWTLASGKVETSAPGSWTDGDSITAPNGGTEGGEGGNTEPATLTLKVPTGVNTPTMSGNVLPTADVPADKTGYVFAGWSETPVTETTTAPTIYDQGTAYTGSATTLYAVYKKTVTTDQIIEFVKVTAEKADWSGEYLIVYETGNVAFDGSLTSLDATNNGKTVTISDGKISATTDLKKSTFTIAKSGNDYTVKSASGYYIGRNDNTNGLNSSEDTTYGNVISLSETNDIIIKSNNCALRYNAASDQLRFRYYKSGQTAVQLYEAVKATTTSYTTF